MSAALLQKLCWARCTTAVKLTGQLHMAFLWAGPGAGAGVLRELWSLLSENYFKLGSSLERALFGHLRFRFFFKKNASAPPKRATPGCVRDLW